jgi:hypothetical protein
MRARSLIVIALLLVPACDDSEPPRREATVELMAMPTRAVSRCGAQALLAEACPTRAPRISRDASGFRFADAGDPRGRYDVVSVEWSGPYPGLTPRNAPPRFAHIVVVGGDVDLALSFRWPTQKPAHERTPDDKRTTPLLLARPSWRGVDGTLVLAPSFPRGGIHGDHLVYRWRQENADYALSLHAWTPLDEAVATLRAVVLFLSDRGKQPSS